MAVAKLKRWDGFETFMGWEAACLIAGVEVSKSIRETNALVNKLLVEMEADYNCARLDLFVMTSTPTRLVPSEDFQPISGLSSEQLNEAIEWCEDGGGDDALQWTMLERSNFEHQYFSRAMLDEWLERRGIATEHRFFGQEELGEPRGDSSQPLSTRGRNTFLKIILGMAMRGYSYLPDADRSGTVKEIVDDLAHLGLSVSDDTVRSVLKEAVREVLPQRRMNSGDKPN